MNDGGPAFPIGEVHPSNADQVVKGMSLRDWFAGEYEKGNITFPDLETMCEYIGEDVPAPADQSWLRRLAAVIATSNGPDRGHWAEPILRQRFITWPGKDRPAANKMRMAEMSQHLVRQVGDER